MTLSEPTEDQIAHRRFLQWRYGEDKIQELKNTDTEVDFATLRQALITKIYEVGLTQMQHGDALALLGATSPDDNIEELIRQADSTALCAVLWATGKEALLPI